MVSRSPEALIAAFAVVGIGYGMAQADLMAGTSLYGLSIRVPLLIAGGALAPCAQNCSSDSANTVLPAALSGPSWARAGGRMTSA